MLSVTLETHRLRLRPFVEADLDAYAGICADADVMRYIGAGQAWSRAEAWRSMAFFLGHWQLRGYGMWAAEERQSGTLVGRIGLHNPEGWPALEIGWLLDRACWGQGLATEGATAVMQFAFEQLNLPRLSSVIQPLNQASIRVAEKLGMTLERNAVINGVDALIYGRERRLG